MLQVASYLLMIVACLLAIAAYLLKVVAYMQMISAYLLKVVAYMQMISAYLLKVVAYMQTIVAYLLKLVCQPLLGKAEEPERPIIKQKILPLICHIVQAHTFFAAHGVFYYQVANANKVAQFA